MLAAASRGALAAARTRLTELAAGLPEAAGIDGVADGLFAVVRLLDGAGQLRRTLADPTTPAQAKDELLDNLLGSQLDPLPMQSLKDVVAQRWSGARDMVDALEVLAVQARFLVAEADGTLDDVEDELFRFARIVAHDPALRAVLTDRALDGDRKRELLQSLLGERVQPATLSIVLQLVLSPRGRTLEAGLDEYAALAADIRSRSVATVTSAVALDAEQQERLAVALGRSLGREVQVQVEVDPKVLGGLVVRVGDEVIDGSTVHRLREARRAIAS
ncbi:MAG: F0F1 ATP synthase subunit delta [Actinobacteria bacterium]|nr:F0F1 ATP synthase subunit delta [Actinomycetota bacterium]